MREGGAKPQEQAQEPPARPEAVGERWLRESGALIVPVGDSAAMTERMEELLRDVALRHRLSAEGLQTAAQYGG